MSSRSWPSASIRRPSPSCCAARGKRSPTSSYDVVADKIDDSRLDDLYRIGVDDISSRKGHRYLSVVADHDRDGAVVVWAKEGHNAETLKAFYDELGDERKAKLQAVWLDMGLTYGSPSASRGAPRSAHAG